MCVYIVELNISNYIFSGNINKRNGIVVIIMNAKGKCKKRKVCYNVKSDLRDHS